MPATLPPIHVKNDYEAEKAITVKNTGTGVIEPAAALAGLVFWLSAADEGAAIHADVTVAATERAGLAGTYFAVFQGDKLNTQLTVGDTVYLVFGDSANIFTSDPVPVLAQRRTR